MQLDQGLRKILSDLVVSLTEVYGNKLKSVILYGSVVKGTATDESDIDIMVLVDADTDELKMYTDRLCDVSSDYALEYFRVFSIIDVCYEEFDRWRYVLPFYKNVDTEGVVIYAA